MKCRLVAATVLMAFTGQFAQAMPLPHVEDDNQPMLVRDGCGPGAHAGRDGYCHPDRDEWRGDWDRFHRPPPPPPFYGPPPRYYDDRYHRPGPCPRGYHLGRNSGVCRPNDDL